MVEDMHRWICDNRRIYPHYDEVCDKNERSC